MKLTKIAKTGAGIKNFYAIAGACVGLTVAGWIGRGAYQNFMAQFDVVLDSIALVREDVHYINVEQSFMAEDLASLHDTLNVMSDQIQQNRDIAESLIMIEQNRDDFNPEQIELILDLWLKKNYWQIARREKAAWMWGCTEKENTKLNSYP